MTFITSHLALGSAEDAAHFAKHIDAVLCCAAEIPLFPGKIGLHLKIDDGAAAEPEVLAEAFRFLDEQMNARRTTLVYCLYGTSRSASVLCGYLAFKQKMPPGQVLELMKELRPVVNPAIITFGSVERYLREILSSRDG